jgi:hypothetical protein
MIILNSFKLDVKSRGCNCFFDGLVLLMIVLFELTKSSANEEICIDERMSQ